MLKQKKEMTIGNVCINKITNSRIGDWYREVKGKLETLEKNRLLINETEKILETFPIKISRKGIERLEKMLERMCKGLEPLNSQTKLLHYYTKKAAQ